MRPNLLIVLVDDLRYDEFGAGGHPYMKTPHIDRIAREGALFERAFHTTPICSPNRASVMTGQYASRHGVIDNVARDAMIWAARKLRQRWNGNVVTVLPDRAERYFSTALL